MFDIIQNIHFLPENIVNYIIPFTYKFQPKELLEDIVSFDKSRKLITDIYFVRWYNFASTEANEDKNWLINDVIRYLNEDVATMYGYTQNFHNIFVRHIMLKNATKEKILKFITKTDYYLVNTQIKIFWGLMNPLEREQFIQLQV